MKFIQQIMRYKKCTLTQVELLFSLYGGFEKGGIYAGGQSSYTL